MNRVNKSLLTYTLSKKQHQILSSLFKSKALYNVLNASRQSGKSYTMSRLALMMGIKYDGVKILVATPYSTQADSFYSNLMLIDGLDIVMDKTIKSPYKSVLLKNGSVIDFRSADNPNSIRGKSYKYVFCDEFSFMKPGAFNEAIVPTMAASGNSARMFFSSTPNGVTGDFYEFAMKGMDSEEVNYEYHFMTYKDNPNCNIELIDAERLRTPSNIFRQEYLGEFVSDGGDVFEGIDKVSIIDSFRPYISTNRYYAGIDWGRADDSTILTILNQDREVIFVKSFKGDWSKQVNDLSIILNTYKPLVYAESNGIGDPLIEQLKLKYANIREFIMSNSSKKEIVEQLRMNIIKQDISLPTMKLCEELFKELSNYTYSMTKTGLISYHHRPNEHDDYVDSLCFANHCLNKHSMEFKNLNFQYRSGFHN